MLIISGSCSPSLLFYSVTLLVWILLKVHGDIVVSKKKLQGLSDLPISANLQRSRRFASYEDNSDDPIGNSSIIDNKQRFYDDDFFSIFYKGPGLLHCFY